MATLRRQCWLFAIGSTLFAIATMPGLSATAGAGLANLLCFIGSWFFTTAGSLAFLVSGVLGIVAVTAVVGIFELKSRDWQAEWINMIGCIAFGVSALGAFVMESGVNEAALLANAGTFVGALCFLIASLLVLPRQAGQTTK